MQQPNRIILINGEPRTAIFAHELAIAKDIQLETAYEDGTRVVQHVSLVPQQCPSWGSLNEKEGTSTT